MHLLDYVNDIFDIAAANNVDWGVAKDMFLANVQNAFTEGAPYYAGCGVDFGVLHPHFSELVDSNMQFNTVVSDNYNKICELRANKDFDAIRSLAKGE